MKSKFVVLKSIRTNDKFFTSNHKDPTKSANGEIWYEVLGYANTVEEAQRILWPTKLDRQVDMTNYLTNMFSKMANLGIPVSQDGQHHLLDMAISGEL